MSSSLSDTINLEANVWTYAAVFKTCKDRAIKNANYSNPASGSATDDEVK